MTVKADVMALYPQESGSTGMTPNPGQTLDRDWIASVRVNRSAVERRCASLGGRRTVKKDWQAAWLLRAMTCIDLTTLDGADTPGCYSPNRSSLILPVTMPTTLPDRSSSGPPLLPGWTGADICKKRVSFANPARELTMPSVIFI